MLIKNAQVLIITDFINQYTWSRAAGAYRIASEIRKSGYSCQVLDCFTVFTDQELFSLFDYIIGDNTLIVGLSTTFFSNLESKDTKNANKILESEFSGYTTNYPYSPIRMITYFNYIKKINPQVKIVMGGYKSSLFDAPGADTFITGLSDSVIIDYLRYLENKNPFLIFTKNYQGQVIIDGDAHNSRFIFSESDIKYQPEDNILPKELLTIEIARGCIFKCKFCSFALNGKKKNDYIKNFDVLRDEFIRNFEEYGITKYYYSDDTHNDNIDKLKGLAKIVQSLPFKLEYAGYIRIDLLNAYPEQYNLLRDGGLKGAFFGIESLNYKSCKAVGKGLHPNKVIDELYKFEDLLPNVGTQGGFICGLPYETKDTLDSWVDKILDVKFPLDSFYLEALFLNRRYDKLYKSEFEVNYQKYYKFFDNSVDNWHNGNFDKNWALNYCRNFYTERYRSRMRVGGWLTLMLHNFGITEDVAKKPIAEIKIDWMKEKNKVRDQYKNLLLKSMSTSNLSS